MTKITRIKAPFEGMDLIVAMECDVYILSAERLKFFVKQFNTLARVNRADTIDAINKVALTVMRMMQPPEVQDNRDNGMLIAIAQVCGKASSLRPNLDEVIWAILDEAETWPMEIIPISEATKRIAIYGNDDYDPETPDTVH